MGQPTNLWSQLTDPRIRVAAEASVKSKLLRAAFAAVYVTNFPGTTAAYNPYLNIPEEQDERDARLVEAIETAMLDKSLDFDDPVRNASHSLLQLLQGGPRATRRTAAATALAKVLQADGVRHVHVQGVSMTRPVRHSLINTLLEEAKAPICVREYPTGSDTPQEIVHRQPQADAFVQALLPAALEIGLAP